MYVYIVYINNNTIWMLNDVDVHILELFKDKHTALNKIIIITIIMMIIIIQNEWEMEKMGEKKKKKEKCIEGFE